MVVNCVASFAEAWIEIEDIESIPISEMNVASFAEAWIEIPKKIT